MTLSDLQTLIDRMYSRNDESRGIEGIFMSLAEECCDLAGAIRSGTKEEQAAISADATQSCSPGYTKR